MNFCGITIVSLSPDDGDHDDDDNEKLGSEKIVHVWNIVVLHVNSSPQKEIKETTLCHAPPKHKKFV